MIGLNALIAAGVKAAAPEIAAIQRLQQVGQKVADAQPKEVAK